MTQPQCRRQAVALPEPLKVAPRRADVTGVTQSWGTPAGWYADPSGRAALRWWDGRAWTEHTADPPPMAYAQGRPVAGTLEYGSFATSATGYPGSVLAAPYPGHHLGEQPRNRELEWLMPVGRTGLSIAAGYAGLVAVFVFWLAPVALILGLLALRGLRDSPLGGRGRAWFGVVAGGLGCVLLAGILVTGTPYLGWPGSDRSTISAGSGLPAPPPVAPRSAVTPGTVVTDPGPPIFINQDRPMPYDGHLAVEGGHGTGSAVGPAFTMPAAPSGRVGVIISQPTGPTSVSLRSVSRPQTQVLLGTCATSCAEQLFVYRGKLAPGSYQVVIHSPSTTQWAFVVVMD